MSRKKTQAVTERKMDSSKIKMDSSLLLLLLNNIPMGHVTKKSSKEV